jgi:hypothetical protein
LAEQALVSSETSDQKLIELQKQIEIDRAQRLIEQQASAQAYKDLSDQAAILQTYSDDLLSRLGSFRGSEEEKHAAAVKALDVIQAGVKAKDLELAVWKYGTIGAVVVIVVAVVWAAVK